MRTRERLLGLKAWSEKNLCDRELKTPGQNMNIADIQYRKPRCFIAWGPQRQDITGYVPDEYDYSSAPFIKLMPRHSSIKNMEEKRFDRYNNIKRPKDMGQQLSVDILFCVYDPGIRLPGFSESVGTNGRGLDMSLLEEGTEEGLFTLTDWMDDCREALLRDLQIENTDLMFEEEFASYSLYTDQAYVVDKRPLYYGFITATFYCYAEDGRNNEIANILN